MFRRCLFLLLLSWSLLAQANNLLVLGDSISAGYGLDKPEQGWVALLHDRLKQRGLEVVNASISGDTTAGGLQRLDTLLQRVKPAWVLVELGGNDGLRGLTPAQMEANLTQIIGKSRAAGARVLLLGMRIPPNYGKRYAEMFQSIYGKVAAAQNASLVPFLLDGVGGEDGLMQQDGIHPNTAAQPLMLEQVWKVLEPLMAAGDKPASNPRNP
jgi:acyl-CoA thioesterase-1